ncbi:Na+/H+ antiporter subunit E [Marinilactibacillus sp. GCM10026970]|uniref:Na+/H+ antiporter subunit E n=1 Tax=Marinilactibacillus sp. GCM10026970 TaxID=3252642 RepID=UPI00361E4CFA
MSSKLKKSFQEVIQNKEIIAILTFIWVILFESFSILTISSGIIVSSFIILFTDQFLLKGNYEFDYLIGLGTLIHFILQLILEIFIAGMRVIPNILKGQGEAQIITCKTILKEELLIDLLANAITLTPGTVTIDKKDNALRILVLNPPKKDEDLRSIIPLEIEQILMKYEKKASQKKTSSNNKKGESNDI